MLNINWETLKKKKCRVLCSIFKLSDQGILFLRGASYEASVLETLVYDYCPSYPSPPIPHPLISDFLFLPQRETQEQQGSRGPQVCRERWGRG